MKESPKHSVMFAIPCYEQKVFASTMVSLMGAVQRISQRGWGVGVETFGGNGGIHIIRNWFCARFLESPCTDLFFLDSDVSCHPDSIVRLIEHDVDVVLGLYRTRSEPERYAFLSYDPLTVENGLMRTRTGPAGFLRIKRHVIQKMADSLTEDQWATMPASGERVPTLFDFVQRKGHYVGEDAFFFLKWEELGGKTWIDPDIELAHMGVQPFTSIFGESLAQAIRHKQETERFEAIVNG